MLEDTRRHAEMAQWAARLHAASGLLALLALLAPAPPGRDTALMAPLGCADLVVAGVILRRPVASWDERRLAVVAVDVAERIRDAWSATPGRPTLSLGVAVHDGLTSSEDTLRRADGAVYDAKRTGRDRVCVADAGVLVA